MGDDFATMLAVGGKSNSLGEVDAVVQRVLHDQHRLDELYKCLFDDDAWTRMRAADALEKVCRNEPAWLRPYVDRFPTELTTSDQPSIQWHVAQIYRQVDLTDEQKAFAVKWLKGLLSTTEVDWIVSANAMDTLAQLAEDGSVSTTELMGLLKIQQHHKSKSVVKRANKLLDSLLG